MKKMAIALISILAVSMMLMAVAPVLAARKLSVTALVTPSSEYSFGLSVATDGSCVVVAAESETVSGMTGAGKVYIYDTADLETAPITLASQNPEEWGLFGSAVAAGGGYVVVGAVGETVDGVWGAGKVYIYTTAGTYVATILNPDTENAEYFGMAVDTDGNYIVVGTDRYYANVGDFYGVGRVYLYDMAGTLIDIIESPTVAGADFGASVAIDNGCVVVSASRDNYDEVYDAGSVYVYATDGTEITYANTLHSPNYQANGRFGNSIAVDGQFIVVGAEAEDVTVGKNLVYDYAGRAYVFTTSGRLFMALKSPNAESFGGFGNSVAIEGTSARDTKIVVSAWREDVVSGDTTYDGAGRVYVYGTGGRLTLISANLDVYINFGYKVAASSGCVVVGSPFEDVGRAYVLETAR